MRIVSQDGLYDLPYGAIIVKLELHSPTITARPFTEMHRCDVTGDYIILAEYSTREKARKALEMLQERYLYLKEYSSRQRIEAESYHFRFPKEEDL